MHVSRRRSVFAVEMALIACLIAGGLWAAIPEGVPRSGHALVFVAAAVAHIRMLVRYFKYKDAVFMAASTTAACFGRIILVIMANDDRGFGLTIYSISVMGLFMVVSWYIAQEVINREVRVLLRG